MIETFGAPLSREIQDLATEVMRQACDREMLLAVAESCTGGVIAAVLTDVEGCAHAFERGFVTYTERAKQELLAVPAELIQRQGAVSHEVAQAMASGALYGSSANLALSTTGFAGPGKPGDEAGLVFFGLARPDSRTVSTCRRFGDARRAVVRKAALRTSLLILRAAMNGAEDFDQL